MPRYPTDVKVYRYTNPGAPQMTGAAGSIVELLKACLVDGYGSTLVSSMTRDGSVVTVTISAGHSFPKYAVVEISGANQTDYNGQHRIETVTSTTFTFTLPEGKTPATPATGTISVKMAPAGWARPYSSADNKRMAFRSTALESTGFYLYVDDTQTTWTRRAGAKGYELMTGIDARSNPFPYSAADDQWVWWYKSDDTSTARPWALVADDRLFYLWLNYNSNNGQRIYAYGDLVPASSLDAWHCLVSGHSSNSNNNYCGGLLAITKVTNIPDGTYVAADPLGVAKGPKCCATSAFVPPSDSSPYSFDIFPACVGSGPFGYPSMVTGAALVSDVYVVHDVLGRSYVRGKLPGVSAPLHGMMWSDGDIVRGCGAVWMALKAYSARWAYYDTNESGPRQGTLFFDIIGPWR